MAGASLLPRLPVGDPGVRDRHQLALPDGVALDEVETLALSRFPAARWEEAPDEAPRERRAVTTALGLRAVGARTLPVRALRVGRSSVVVGPYRLEPDDAAALGLPAGVTVAWDVHAPRDRGGPPLPGVGDRDGLARAFPDGLPVREEDRVVRWLVAAARRLGGATRLGPVGAVVEPDPDAAVDLTVLTATWLEPSELLAVVRGVAPTATGPGTGAPAAPVAGPPPRSTRRGRRAAEAAVDPALAAALGTHGVPDPVVRERLLAAAREADAAALSAPPPPTGHGVLVDLGLDGLVAVEAAARDEVHPLLRDVPWTARGVVGYTVRWEPPDLVELGRERPSLEHRRARDHAIDTVVAVARTLHGVVGGEVADEADFLVDPADLGVPVL
ncbi:hypothetical protein [Cellulomonas endophytica]|uniref:hypothetical protein n=1 Tax=Cellulomonas endophytica TaxID=2494735 RepID=UPI00101304D6|nr:hypothetical protein [Cellulomonas endophytica]